MKKIIEGYVSRELSDILLYKKTMTYAESHEIFMKTCKGIQRYPDSVTDDKIKITIEIEE